VLRVERGGPVPVASDNARKQEERCRREQGQEEEQDEHQESDRVENTATSNR